jgi:hypothetical protein
VRVPEPEVGLARSLAGMRRRRQWSLTVIQAGPVTGSVPRTRFQTLIRDRHCRPACMGCLLVPDKDR